MKVLSMRGLWGYLIATGIKDVENRRTLKNIRGWHLIHISKNFDEKIDINTSLKLLSPEEETTIFRILFNLGVTKLNLKKEFKNYTGSIIGAMYIEDCRQNYKSKWAEKKVNNLILDIKKSILFDKPIKDIKGKLSVWDYELPSEYYDKYPQLK